MHKDLEHKKKLFISKWYLLEKDDGGKKKWFRKEGYGMKCDHAKNEV